MQHAYLLLIPLPVWFDHKQRLRELAGRNQDIQPDPQDRLQGQSVELVGEELAGHNQDIPDPQDRQSVELVEAVDQDTVDSGWRMGPSVEDPYRKDKELQEGLLPHSYWEKLGIFLHLLLRGCWSSDLWQLVVSLNKYMQYVNAHIYYSLR